MNQEPQIESKDNVGRALELIESLPKAIADRAAEMRRLGYPDNWADDWKNCGQAVYAAVDSIADGSQKLKQWNDLFLTTLKSATKEDESTRPMLENIIDGIKEELKDLQARG